MTPERFTTLRAALSRRQPDLTVLMENVHKPHNYAAVLRSCDAVGVLEAHAIASTDITWRYSNASASAAKWVDVRVHDNTPSAAAYLKERGFALYAAHLSDQAVDFRDVDYTQPCAIIIGTEKYGISDTAAGLADKHIVVPMRGLVDSLNVSVASAVILFEAERQRREKCLYDSSRIDPTEFKKRLFEWSHPEVAALCRGRDLAYPELDDNGYIIGDFPRG